MSKQRRLGKGLEALLGRPLEENTTERADVIEPQEGAPSAQATSEMPAAAPASSDGIAWLNVYEIDRNPFQPRQTFDEGELQTLAESIVEHGMLQPVVVRRVGGRHQLVSGERRWRAATVAGWECVPAQVRDVDDRQMAELAIVENVQRKDLNPLEKAASFQRYIEQYGCTQEELASRVKVDRSTIANLIRLLELPDSVQDALRSGAISQGHARALLPLGEEREQKAFCRRIQDEGLSVRATEEWVQETVRKEDTGPLGIFTGDSETPASPRTRSEHLASLEQELRTALGAKVDLRQTGKGRGRIVIHFKTHDEFERLHKELTATAAVHRERRAG